MINKITLLLAFSFLLTFTSAQLPDWGTVLGDPNTGAIDVENLAAAVDHNGNTYLGGYIRAYSNSLQTADLDPGPGQANVSLVLGDYHQAYWVRLDSNGQYVNHHFWGSTGNDEVEYMGVDGNGNVISVGIFEETVDFDPGPGVLNLTATPYPPPYSSWEDIFVQKLDANGNLLWVRQFGNEWRELVRGLKVDAQGNSYVMGMFRSVVDFDPGPGTVNVSSGDWDIFVQKLDPNGDFEWVATTSGGSLTSTGLHPRDLEVDAAGNVFVTGTFWGAVDFAPGAPSNLLNSNQGESFVWKLTSTGHLGWIRQFGQAFLTHDNTLRLGLDASANVYVAGQYGLADADFDPSLAVFNLPDPGPSADGFVMALDSAGNFQWAGGLAGNHAISIAEVGTTPGGSPVITGSFEHTVDFDPDTNSVFNLISNPTNQLYANGFVLELSPGGQFQRVDAPALNAIGRVEPVGCVFGPGNGYTWYGHQIGTADYHPTAGSLTLSGGHPFIVRYEGDSCATLGLPIDSIQPVSCTGDGLLAVGGAGGTPPYTYAWALTPPVTDSVIQPTTKGLYTVSVTDSDGCQQSRTQYIDGPDTTSALDLALYQWWSPAQAGQLAYLWLHATNLSCLPAGGPVQLVFDGPLTFLSANQPGYTQNGDTLTWQVPNISFDSGDFVVQLTFLVDSLATTADTVCYAASVPVPAGDVQPANNAREACFAVVNAYDPNDKQVLPQGICDEHFTDLDGAPLTYTVRFQNTGNAPAQRVIILDSLSPWLDVQSLNVIHASHSMTTQVLAGPTLKFQFDDIQLPDSATNEAASHGYVIFELDPVVNVPNLTEVSNGAAIYFDWNPPIFTNRVFNTLVDSLPNCFPVAIQPELASLRMYPNPNQGAFFIESAEWGNEVEVEVYDLNGRRILSRNYAGTDRIQVELQTGPGLYLVRVREVNGKWKTGKVLVE